MMLVMPDDRHIPGLALPRTLLRIVGVSCYVLAALALLYSIMSIAVVIVRSPFDDQTPYGMHFFILFVAIVMVIQLFMLFCADQLMRLRTNVRHILLIVSLVMIASLVVPGFFLWSASNPRISMSAAAATGIGQGGLTLYMITLFPLWGPAIVYWAHRRLEAVRIERGKSGLCVHCGYDLRGSKDTCPECGLH
jgi:hypothetical protein